MSDKVYGDSGADMGGLLTNSLGRSIIQVWFVPSVYEIKTLLISGLIKVARARLNNPVSSATTSGDDTDKLSAENVRATLNTSIKRLKSGVYATLKNTPLKSRLKLTAVRLRKALAKTVALEKGYTCTTPIILSQ